MLWTPPSEQTPCRSLGYLVFGPKDTLVQLLMWLCRQGCSQVTGALGCSRQRASGATETSPDLELCHENHPFLWHLDDELQNLHLLAENLPSEHCPFSEILAEASDTEMQLRKRGLSTKCVIRAQKVTPAEGTYSQYGLSSRQKKMLEDEETPFFFLELLHDTLKSSPLFCW